MADPFQTGAAAPAGEGDASDAPRLSQVLARLEEIRKGLDRDDLDLEDLMVLYREGCTLAASARRLLETARAEVEFLMEEGEGPSAGGA
ncbi:MAG: exodeoxyribonuclease VII small subunit [Gemmatimonadota bacterium]|nr:exodeoxyribonuclease VII small subunit [Gemmatimonadota bacterium]